MTCRAVRRGSDVVLLAQAFAESDGVAGRGPGHVRHLFRRPEVFIRIAMALETPAHAERLLLEDFFHFVDTAVAADAADAANDVRAVVEEDEVGQVMDLHPLDRLPRGDAL